MEKFYLREVSINRKEDILDYINEIDKYNSDTNGMGALVKVFEGYSIDDVIDITINMKKYEYSKKIGRWQSKTYLLIRENDERIVGMINIRLNLNKEMLRYSGHIGYGIRPTERNKGYSKIVLYLGLIEVKKIGLNKVILVSDDNNIASNKTIKDLGGVLVNSEIDPSDLVLTNSYCFDVDKCLEMYKDVYKKYIY